MNDDDPYVKGWMTLNEYISKERARAGLPPLENNDAASTAIGAVSRLSDEGEAAKRRVRELEDAIHEARRHLEGATGGAWTAGVILSRSVGLGKCLPLECPTPNPVEAERKLADELAKPLAAIAEGGTIAKGEVAKAVEKYRRARENPFRGVFDFEVKPTDRHISREARAVEFFATGAEKAAAIREERGETANVLRGHAEAARRLLRRMKEPAGWGARRGGMGRRFVSRPTEREVIATFPKSEGWEHFPVYHASPDSVLSSGDRAVLNSMREHFMSTGNCQWAEWLKKFLSQA